MADEELDMRYSPKARKCSEIVYNCLCRLTKVVSLRLSPYLEDMANLENLSM